MEIYEYTPGKSVGIGPSVIALGFFDGVHLGHRSLLKTAKTAAEKRGLTFAVFTFPAEDGFKGGAIYSTKEKLTLFESLGVEAVIMTRFNSVSAISAEDFVLHSLIEDMSCRVAVAGYDYRFGKGASGNAAVLSEILSLRGRECIVEDEHKINGEKISTTKIKELLSMGNVSEACEFLGAPYRICSTVEHGNGVGASLGFPTVNTEIPPQSFFLKRGVYRTVAEIRGVCYNSVTNVGTCPTFQERQLHAETYITDYSGNLYGEQIRIFFLGYLREEKAFSSEKELIMQINVDKNRAIKENGDLKWQEIGLS